MATLGRGEVHFAKFKPRTTAHDGFRFLGNCPAFNLTRSSETLDHYDSTRGLRVKDVSVDLEVTNSGTIECDNVVPENLALFFMAEVEHRAASAETGVNYTIESASPGRGYQLGATATDPVGHSLISNVEVTAGGTPLVEGVDYSVDLDRGFLRITESTTAVTPDSEVTVTYDVGASQRTIVIAGDQQIEGALMFKAYNPVGERVDYLIPHAKLSPNGDIALIGDDWQVIPLNVEALKMGDLAPIYANGQPFSVAP